MTGARSPGWVDIGDLHVDDAVVFMHAYPRDLAADGEDIARIFADARVAFVDTGHTHDNEPRNDRRVVYGATRSTGEIEEGGGQLGPNENGKCW